MRTKSRKALSPVVASIILIAVTVAVSIAVAAWMGALTFGFMGSSSITITNVEFNSATGNATAYMTLILKNTGTKQVTVAQVKVNNLIQNFDPTNAVIAAGLSNVSLAVYCPWVNGNPYKIDLYDASGTGVGSTQQNVAWSIVSPLLCFDWG